NLEPRDDIWPTETTPVFRRREDGVELVQLRWGIPPARPKRGPVINFCSEGRRFLKARCVSPASHFIESAGATPPKSKGKFPRRARTGSALRASGARCPTAQGTL